MSDKITTTLDTINDILERHPAWDVTLDRVEIVKNKPRDWRVSVSTMHGGRVLGAEQLISDMEYTQARIDVVAVALRRCEELLLAEIEEQGTK